MRKNNLNGYRTANAFIKAKLKAFNNMERNFDSLYHMMFSERDNVIYERSKGYRIERVTYGESSDSIELKAGRLLTILPDVTTGDVVGIYMENSLDWIEAFWAVLRIGCCPLLMNLRLGADVLEGALAELGAKAVISDSATFSVRTILSQDLTADGDPIDSADYGTTLYVMSSGTSDSVKLCAYTAEEMCCQINDSYTILTNCKRLKKRYEGELKLLTFLPFYHIFGLVAVYVWFAFFSRTFVHLGSMSPQTIVNTIRRHKVTHIFAVPMFWDKVYDRAISTIKKRGDSTYNRFCSAMRLMDRINCLPLLRSAFRRLAFREVRDNMFGESICFMITGGSGIRSEVIRFFNNIGYHLANGYGMSEIGITSVELSSDPRKRNSGSVGKPLPSVEYKINNGGELLVRGRTTAKYVLCDGKRTDNDDWFNTHDLAEYRDGRYYILGRQDDLIISASGENLNPNIAEPLLYGIDGANEICIIGAHSGNGVVPTLVVSVDKYITPDGLATLRRRVGDRLTESGLDGQITRVYYTSSPLIVGDEIKLNRRRITADYDNGVLPNADDARVETQDGHSAVYDRVAQAFADSIGCDIAEIYADMDFFADCGGTSLDYFAMTAELAEEFGTEMPTVNGRSLSTVREITEFIEGQMA